MTRPPREAARLVGKLVVGLSLEIPERILAHVHPGGVAAKVCAGRGVLEVVPLGALRDPDPSTKVLRKVWSLYSPKRSKYTRYD